MKKVFLILFWITSILWAQKKGQFPYSVFGFGEFEPMRFHHQNLNGGLSSAVLADTLFPTLLNSAQPASLPDIRFATFEVGGKNRLNRLYRGNVKSEYYNLTNFDYAALGVPLGNKGGLSFGIAPFSAVGYSLETVDFMPGIGNITYKQSGDGGFNQAFLGAGIQPFKFTYVNYSRRHSGKDTPPHKGISRFLYRLSQLRLGMNGAWIFGQLIRQTDIRYPNNIQNLNHFRESIIRPKGIMGSFGIMLPWVQDSLNGRALKEKNIYTLGFCISPSTPIKLSEELYSFNYFSQPVNVNLNIKDSAEKSVRENIRYRLPLQFSTGFNFKKGYSWNAGMEFARIAMKERNTVFSAVPMEDISILAAGISWVPDKFSYGKGTYLKRTRYAAGINHTSGYVKSEGKYMQALRATAGLSLPIGIRTGTGMLHLGFQYYQNTLAPQTFFKERGICFLFGITFNSTYLEDFWFRKFRYD
ncbi:MAG: hypothetical protein N3F09_09605 [Bacteroidia bacterium]|nr:hypothetical protein [Bacteroidia bacterium]